MEGMVGDCIIFILMVNNVGFSCVIGVIVSEEIVSGFSFIEIDFVDGSFDLVSGIWNIGDIVVGEIVLLIFMVEFNVNGNFCNEVFVFIVNEMDVDFELGNEVDIDGDGEIVDDLDDEDDGDGICIEVFCQVLVMIILQSECNDNGILINLNDDFIIVMIQVDGINVLDSWVVNVWGE